METFKRDNPYPTIGLVELVKKLKPEAENILDLCCGSGFLAYELSKVYPMASIRGCDINKKAIIEARKQLPDCLFFTSDLFESVQGTFDIIVSDPPYMPSRLCAGLEPRNSFDGGENGDDIVNRIAAEFLPYLNDGGIIAMEVEPYHLPSWQHHPDRLGFNRFVTYTKNGH